MGARSEDSDPSNSTEDGIPSNAHPDTHQQHELSEDLKDQQSSDLDLTACQTVSYEMRNDVPGVTFSAENGWMPVVHQQRRTRQRTPTPSSTKPESSDEELEIHLQNARQVEYKERDGTPGLKMRLGCTNHSIK